MFCWFTLQQQTFFFFFLNFFDYLNVEKLMFVREREREREREIVNKTPHMQHA